MSQALIIIAYLLEVFSPFSEAEVNAGVFLDRNSNVSICVNIACNIVQIVMVCKSVSRRPHGLQQSLFSLAACSPPLSTFWFPLFVMVACPCADMSFVVAEPTWRASFSP